MNNLSLVLCRFRTVSLLRKIITVLDEELIGVHPRWLLARLLAAPLPVSAGGRLRTVLLRSAGFRIGKGTIFSGMPTITGKRRQLTAHLTVGRDCWFNLGSFFDLGAALSIGDSVYCGQQVLFLTSSHHLGDEKRRAGPVFTRPIKVESGVWIGARAVILPGVCIGSGSVIAAGAVVNRDVPVNTLVGGVPARPIRALDLDEEEVVWHESLAH